MRDVPVRAALECICVEVEVRRQFKTNSFLIPLGAFVRENVQDFRDENAGRTGLNIEEGAKTDGEKNPTASSNIYPSPPDMTQQ